MTHETEADRTEFFLTSDFAVSVTYSPCVGTPSTVLGIFDNGYKEVEAESIGIESRVPSFQCKSSDVDGVQHGDTVTLADGNIYNVIGVRQDGEGIVTLDFEDSYLNG